MDGWTQTLSASTLLGIAAAAILLILILIVKLRVHALLTLVFGQFADCYRNRPAYGQYRQ